MSLDQPSAVIDLANKAGATGVTTHDVQSAFGWGDSARSRTLSDLVRTGRLVRLEEKRRGATVHVVPDSQNDRPSIPFRSQTSRAEERGYARGHVDGFTEGLRAAFTQVDNSDTIGDALMLLRRMIQESE